MPTTAVTIDKDLEAYQAKMQEQNAANSNAQTANDDTVAQEAARIAAESAQNGQDAEQKKAAEEKALADKAAADAEIERKRIDAENNVVDIDYEKVDADKVVEKKTAGKYKGWKEIEEKINAEPEEKDPFIEKYSELRKKGVSHEAILKTMATDISKMSDIEKVKEGLALEKPHLSKEDIDIIVAEDYPINALDADDEESVKRAKRAQIKLKDDAIRFEKTLKEMQVKALEPIIDPKKAEAELAQLQEQEKRRLFQEQYDKKATEELGKFKEVKIKIGDKDEDVFVYQPDESQMKLIAEYVKSPQKVFALWRNEDGTPNIPKMIEGLAYLTNASNMNQKKAEAMKALAIEEYIKGKKNVDFNSGNKNQQSGTSNKESLKALADKHS